MGKLTQGSGISSNNNRYVVFDNIFHFLQPAFQNTNSQVEGGFRCSLVPGPFQVGAPSFVTGLVQSPVPVTATGNTVLAWVK